MPNQTETTFILVALFGAFAQEVLYWYDIRNKLDADENKKLLNSKYYWIVTFAMIFISGVATWLLFYDKGTAYPNKIPFVLGAAFPLVFKKMVAALQSRDLGDIEKSKNKSGYAFDDVTKIYFK